MKIDIGFSPCPNDTFIFDAMVNGKIDTGELEFNAVLEDVQMLNEWALQGKLPVSKISYGVLPLILEKYKVLQSGSALGKGVGPLLISKKGEENTVVENSLIAIPGENTTAHLLFSMAYPQAKNKKFVRYDEVEDFVLSGKGLGVIIHENRFTYKDKGLGKIQDLGDFWENSVKANIPLGGIVVSRNLDAGLAKRIDAIICQSIEFAWKEYPNLSPFITSHAQEMSEAVMRQHIELYVNDYSKQLGEQGRAAVEKLISIHPAGKGSLSIFE